MASRPAARWRIDVNVDTTLVSVLHLKSIARRGTANVDGGYSHCSPTPKERPFHEQVVLGGPVGAR